MLKKNNIIFRTDFWVGLENPQKGEKEREKRRKAFYIMRSFFLGIMVDLHEKRSKLDTYKSLNIIALAHT